MKELSIEEKAKRYDDAIEIAKEINNEQRAQPFNVMTKVFPELKESDDEMIRKTLIHYMKDYSDGTSLIHAAYGVNRNDAIAWLEKQGEQKSITPKFRVGDTIRHIPNKDNQSQAEYKIERIKDGFYYLVGGGCVYESIDEFELVEQKSVDKVELKFREGEWVVSPNGVYWHIDKISNNRYEVTSNTGESSNWPLDTNIYHSFSIQDAKDGDVLAVEAIEENYQYPFVAICKEHGLDFFNSYCFIGFDGKFYEADTGHSTEKIHPATKEQRDLLFQKIKEAGHELDYVEKNAHIVDIQVNV